MMTAQERARRAAKDADAWRAADVAAKALQEALARVGVTFPSLRASEPVNSRGFLDLGGLGAGTAVRLAEILTQAADEIPDLRTTAP